MATQIQYRRGTNAQNAAFTGALGEITVDTTNGTLRVHNGITAGGSNIATVAYVSAQISSLSSNSITDGTSNVRVFANGNVATSVAGTANVLLVQSTGVLVTGDLSVTGNATLSGNILGDRIQNGNTQIDIQVAGGNANISVGGTSNVAVFASTGAFITGVTSVSGNVTGGNFLTAGLISATSTITSAANITGSNLLTGGLISATSTITSAANITGSNLLTGGLISATSTITSAANITGSNLLTGGLISATGSITSAANISLTGNIVDSGELYINTLANGNINLNTNGTGQTNIPAGILSVTGNIQAGNLRTAGLISATGSITTAGDISITGNIVDTGALTVSTSSNGNITLAPNGTGVIVVNTDIRNGQANGTGNIGASGAGFNTIFAKATSAQYADLAELYEANEPMCAGQVVEFGGEKEIQQTTTSHSTQVAGVISTKPSYLMNSELQGEFVYPVALTGRVPCHVVGTIKKGDLLVSSSVRAVATAMNSAQYQPGCVIGKALENYNSQEIGTIEIAIGRF